MRRNIVKGINQINTENLQVAKANQMQQVRMMREEQDEVKKRYFQRYHQEKKNKLDDLVAKEQELLDQLRQTK